MAAEAFNHFSNVLCGVNFLVDGVSTGIGDYNQRHDVGKAFFVGFIHGGLSTLGSYEVGSQWAAGFAIGGEMGDPVGGGLIGGVIGGVVGGYIGGAMGDSMADDWCNALNL
jgi:hypothetical protein